MKVKMLVGITGTLNGQPWPQRGEIADLPDQVAEDLLINKYAERVSNSKVEAAAVDPVEETASKPAPKTRKA
jgi:hypothetical protein